MTNSLPLFARFLPCRHIRTIHGYNSFGLTLCQVCDMRKIKLRAALDELTGKWFALPKSGTRVPQTLISLKYWEMRND